MKMLKFMLMKSINEEKCCQMIEHWPPSPPPPLKKKVQ